MKRAIRAICALLLTVAVTGCSMREVLTTVGVGAAVAGGVATVYYFKGDLEADFENDIDSVYNASVLAMEKRGYTVTGKNIGVTSGRIEANIPAEGAENKHDLIIKLDRVEKNLSHISIRVGVFGDEALSREILDDIEARLS